MCAREGENISNDVLSLLYFPSSIQRCSILSLVSSSLWCCSRRFSRHQHPSNATPIRRVRPIHALSTLPSVSAAWNWHLKILVVRQHAHPVDRISLWNHGWTSTSAHWISTESTFLFLDNACASSFWSLWRFLKKLSMNRNGFTLCQRGRGEWKPENIILFSCDPSYLSGESDQMPTFFDRINCSSSISYAHTHTQSESDMKCVPLILVSVLLVIHLTESIPSAIYRPARSLDCSPDTCFLDPSFCYCGSEAPAADSCCTFQCRRCPDVFIPISWDFGIGPLNFFPLGPFNFTGINWSLLGR